MKNLNRIFEEVLYENDKKLLAQLKSDYNHLIIRYNDVEKCIEHLKNIEDYKHLSELEIRKALGK